MIIRKTQAGSHCTLDSGYVDDEMEEYEEEGIGAHSGDHDYDYDYLNRTPSLIKAVSMRRRKRIRRRVWVMIMMVIMIIRRAWGLQPGQVDNMCYEFMISLNDAI